MVESPKRGLLAAYRRLLSPLVRILIRNGVDFEDFTEVAKRAYVDVASKDSGRKSGQKRISVLTGLSEQEVSDVVERGRDDLVHSNLNQIAVTLTGWHTDFEFTGPYGVPIELKLPADTGLDFEELVDRHVDDETLPAALLKELVRVGTVVETEKGWFKPVSRFYIPEGSAPNGMDHLSRSVEEFATTLDHNTQEQHPTKRRFERQTYTTDGIRPEDLPRFEDFAYTRARLLLEEIDNWVSQLEPPDKLEKEQLVTGLGIYHYISNESAEQKN